MIDKQGLYTLGYNGRFLIDDDIKINQQLTGRPFPAYAGMNRPSGLLRPGRRSVPCIRGDEPLPKRSLRAMSPFPAYAGMNRSVES